MSTPWIDATLERLGADLGPTCKGERHGDARPPADYWLDIHGCVDIFQCAECLDRDSATVRSWGWAQCTHCHQAIPADRFVTRVVPLRVWGGRR